MKMSLEEFLKGFFLVGMPVGGLVVALKVALGSGTAAYMPSGDQFYAVAVPAVVIISVIAGCWQAYRKRRPE
jgi:hypothetical protein